MEALMISARCGHMTLKDVMAVVDKEGKSVVASFRDHRKRTVLHYAAAKGEANICSYLINEIGIDVNAFYGEGQTPLKKATKKSNMETIECLLNHGADPCVLNIGPTILCKAARIGSLRIMKLLLDKGVNIDAKSYEGITALVCAASAGQSGAVKFLVEHGAKVQPQEEFNSSHEVTPLSYAVSSGSIECFDHLIKAGADPKLIQNPLHIAASSGSVKLVAWFLQFGADPDSCDCVDGLKPIQVAAQRNHVDVVELLFPCTRRISGVLNWSVAGIIETFVENKTKDVTHKEAISRRISSTKMNVSILSDEEINLKIKAMVPKEEYQFFSKWSATKKRLFYESTLYGLPEPKRIFNYDVGTITSSVIFDTTSASPTKVQASYLRAISVYRLWHFARSDTVYELGPGGNKITVSREDGTFVFWFRYKKNDVGVVIDGQSIWIDGFLRRTCNDSGSFTYRPPIHFCAGSLKHTDSNGKGTFEEYIIASDLMLSDLGGQYSGSVSQLKLEVHAVRGAVIAISDYKENMSFRSTCHNASDMLILYSSEAGKNNWIFQYTMKSLERKQVEVPISVPCCLDGTVTNHRQVSHSALNALDTIAQKTSVDASAAPDANPVAASTVSTAVDAAAAAADTFVASNDNIVAATIVNAAAAADVAAAVAADDDDEQEEGNEEEEKEDGGPAAAAAAAAYYGDDEKEKEKEEGLEEEEGGTNSGSILTGPAEDDDVEEDKLKRREEEEKAYKTVTGVPFRKLAQCLDAYVVLRRRKVVKTRFFLPNKKSEFMNQETDAIMKENDESDKHFKERVLAANLRRGTLFTVEEHSGIGKHRGRLWPMPPRPCSKKKGTKIRWFYLAEPE